jgi:serine phosphatase RsbU (regulator of sigma subunit)
MEDLRRTRWHSDYLRELRDLYLFYLDDDSRQELASMGRIRRAFSLLAWLLKSLLLKLSPTRRLLLLVAFVLGVMGWTQFRAGALDFEADLRPWGFVLLLVILMLELRDKLLARDEIEIARQVQLALLPRSHPRLPGWSVWSYSRPANDVGGDLVDYIELDGFRHGILLGDVAGKGLGAALLSAKLQATLRALLPETVSLADLGGRVNTILQRDGLDNRFATLFLVELEYDSGQIRYLNAGHNPPFVVRRDRVEQLPASSLPLGMLASAGYAEGDSRLEPGDLLVAYSDGLTEATGPDDEEFGVDRVERVVGSLRGLAPELAGRRILDEVEAFLAASRPDDDLSLVVVRREPAAAG